MSQAAPEWSAPVALDAIGGTPATHHIEASQEQRAALAKRFDIEAIESLSAELNVSRDGPAVSVSGRVSAQVVQSCVATGDPVSGAIDEKVSLLFVPENTPAADEEVELEEEDCETVFYEGGAIDLGEAAAQTMALALDPFPRSPDADEALREAGALSEKEAGPFGALKALRDKLGE